MRWLKVAVVLAALTVMATVAQATVPSFTRQTGLACNQCHMTWTPTPDLTFTGIKFRLNGYRTPFVAEKIEAGEEGALNGRRLVLGLQNYWTVHYRSNVFSQSKPTSLPTAPTPKAAPVVSNPFNSVGLDYAGPIGEHFGIWNEYYFAANGGNENVYNLVSNDEFDVRYVANPGGNILGVLMSTQSITSSFFGAFGSGTASNIQRSGAGGNGHAPYVNLAAYAFVNDRAIAMVGVQPGEDNLDYKRMNYQAVFGYMPLNADSRYLLITGTVKVGNDMVPQVSSLRLNQQTNAIGYRDAIEGVSAARAAAGGPSTSYTAGNTGDNTRFLLDVRYGGLDHGAHSFTSAFGFSVENEKYDDGAEVKLRALGGTVRYMYDRTWGINFGLNKRLTYEYTLGGTTHDIPTDLGFNVLAIYRPAMNVAFELGFSNSQTLALDTNWRNGWNWSLQWHFLY